MIACTPRRLRPADAMCLLRRLRARKKTPSTRGQQLGDTKTINTSVYIPLLTFAYDYFVFWDTFLKLRWKVFVFVFELF